MEKTKQTIKCDVNNCRYNDDTDCLCTLNTVDISCTCNRNTCDDMKETICSSFKEK